MYSDRAAWIVIHADEDGKLGQILGQQPIPAGRSENVIVTIYAIYATRTMHAVLYEDAGTPGSFEIEKDLPLSIDGKIVSAQFDQKLQ